MIRHNAQKITESVVWTFVYLFILVADRYTKSNNVIKNYILSGNNNDNGFGFGVVLLLGGLFTFYKSLKNLKKKRLFENIPTSKMRSIAMGLVEIKGKIKVADKTLEDPFDEKECVYWNVTIEEYVKRGKRRTWVTRHRLKKSVTFFLSDDTGSVLINSNKAYMNNIKRDSEIETATLFSEELPSHIIEYCDKYNVKYEGWFGFKKKLRCRTTYIEPGDQLYIIGSARPLNEEEINFSKDATAAIDHSNGEYFLISDKSEKELTDAHGGQSWLVPGSIMLSAFGLWMILVSLGIF